jgi:hypothetical protein
MLKVEDIDFAEQVLHISLVIARQPGGQLSYPYPQRLACSKAYAAG